MEQLRRIFRPKGAQPQVPQVPQARMSGIPIEKEPILPEIQRLLGLCISTAEENTGGALSLNPFERHYYLTTGESSLLSSEAHTLAERLLGKHSGMSSPDAYADSIREAVSGMHISGRYAFARALAPAITGCSVFGSKALTNSISPAVSGSLIVGRSALSQAKESPFPIPEGFDARRREAVSKLEQIVRSGNPELVLQAIFGFIPGQPDMWWYKAAEETLGMKLEDGPMSIKEMDTYMTYSSIIGRLRMSLPEGSELLYKLQDMNVSTADIVVSAVVLDRLLHHISSSGAVWNVSIDNSVVVGLETCNGIMGGTIRNSIIAGRNPLEAAHVKLENTYIVTPSGTRFVRQEVVGSPQSYAKIPLLRLPGHPKMGQTSTAAGADEKRNRPENNRGQNYHPLPLPLPAPA